MRTSILVVKVVKDAAAPRSRSYRCSVHYAVVLDRLLDSYILLHHLLPSPLPSLCCVRSLPFSVDLESAP